MLIHRKLLIMAIIACSLGITYNLSACLTTFINDTDPIIHIFDKTNQILIPIRKNEKRRFGNAHKHADFDIFTQESHKRIFTKVYTCKQHACGTKGNIELKFSDIKNRTDITKFFTITEYGPYSSMAERVANNLKKCAACSQE